MTSVNEIDTNNQPCYYFDDIININDLDLENILIDEKSYKNVLIYDVAYKTSYGAKPLHTDFEKVNGYIIKYNKIRYLTSYHSNKKMKEFLIELRYLIMLQSNISDVYSHKYAKFEIGSDNDLPSEKTITIHIVTILDESVLDENDDYCYLWKIVHKNNMKMLYYDKIGNSEDIDVHSTSSSRNCIICYYCYI